MSRRTDPITNRRCATVQLASCRVSCIVTAIVTARRTVRFPVLYSFCWLVGPCGLLCSLAPCRACKFLYAARRLSLEKRVSKSWSCHENKKWSCCCSPFCCSLLFIWFGHSSLSSLQKNPLLPIWAPLINNCRIRVATLRLVLPPTFAELLRLIPGCTSCDQILQKMWTSLRIACQIELWNEKASVIETITDLPRPTGGLMEPK